jgi:hypothetical protein
MSESAVAVAEPDSPTRQMLRQMLAEELAARQPRTGMIEVDREEYEALKARDGQIKRLQGTLDLTQARMRELEGLLLREQTEHKKECEQMLAHIRRLGG